jgi:hypothetical protein
MTGGNPDDDWLERGKARFPVAAGVNVLGRTQISTLRVFLAVLVIGLVTVAPAASAPSVPTITGPADGTDVTFLPAFAWERAAGADHYEFQLAADTGFNSVVYSVSTKNTRATPDKTVPNGTYYWRVRSIDSSGGASGWSPFSTIVKLWAGQPVLNSPANGALISYPADPLILRWAAMQGAAKYRVYIAPNSGLTNLVSGSNPFEVQALNLVPNVLLPQNTYYWAVTPLDAQGNPGEQSPIRSFSWVWPSTTTPALADLNATSEVFDPQFSWDPIPGAARYEVEVNSDNNFDPASKACCSDKPISTTLTPLEVFANNTYYWRVRALDRDGNAGVWNEGEPFVKRFDNYPDLSEDSIKRLRMLDANDPTGDLTGVVPYATDDPIVTWDPVPGAASYEVEVVPFEAPNLGDPVQCNWGASTFRKWNVKTASTSWTPLGSGSTASAPFPTNGLLVSKDFRGLVAGESYCVRVRARSGRVTLTTAIWGDHTYIGNGNDEPSFNFTDFPVGAPCSACNAGYLGTDDYSLPVRGETVGANPLFTWKPIAGKQSYWVIVAKDPSFTTIIDYAFTQTPAYAVRTGSAARTYADEETSYYWVVLPASGTNGSGAPGNPALGAYADFQKQTTPPAQLAPLDGAVFTGQPTFEWTSIFGARRYHLQVDDELSFSSPIDNVVTSSTAYTSLKSYNSAQTFYWRVAPEDENNTGLTWTDPNTFQVDLPTPVMNTADLGTGDFLPVVQWQPVGGAVEYELQVQEADGDHQEYAGFPSTAASWEKMSGVGILTLKVRALFPTSSTLTRVAGPWSNPTIFTHTIREPANPASDAGQNRLVLSWDAKTGTKQYKVQVSSREDFAPFVESKLTDNPTFAPTLNSGSYASGGHFFWRVAAVDSDGNVGDWVTRTFDLPALTTIAPPLKQFKLSSTGRLVKNRSRAVTVTVKNLSNLTPVFGASVRASGQGVLVTKYTNSNGVASFTLKPTRLGLVTFRVSKNGYATKSFTKRVYAP